MRPQIGTSYGLPLVAAAFLLALPTPAAAQCSQQSTRGRVSSVDVALGRFTAHDNLIAAPGPVYVVDAATDFRGVAGSLAELQPGFDVDLRYCANTNPRLVLRLTSSLPATPPAAALVVDLADGPGQEALPVTRVFGDDPGEILGGYRGDGMATGDVNGDGLADTILVGGRSPVSFSRAALVLYGSAEIAGAQIDLNSDGAVSAHGETRLQATVPFQSIGLAVESGDLDGDGFDDVFVGQDAGTHVVFGGPDLPGTTVAIDPAAAGPDGFRLLTEAPPQALAAGDLDGDGRTDLVSQLSAEAVTVVFGRADLRGTTVDLRGVTGSVPGVARIRVPFGGSVSSLATGDANGDGVTDLVIAIQRGLSPSLTSAVVVYGSGALRDAVIDLGAGTSPAGGPAETRIFGLGMNAAACADVDGDGIDDVLLASANVTGPGDNFAVGAVYVLYGGAALPGTTPSLTGPVNPDETRIRGLEEFGELGTGLSAADLDGDGRADLVMPAPGSVPYGTLPETNTLSDGAVYVFRGRTGLRGVELLDPREVADTYVFAAAANDRFGSVVAAADLDRDGLPDLIASAAQGDHPALGNQNGAGTAAFLFRHGLARPDRVSVTRPSRAGDGPGGGAVPPAAFGPVVRATVDFPDGDLATAGTTTVTLEHQGPPAPAAAAVQWTVETNRTGWSHARLTFRYTDAEIAGLREGRLGIWRAETPAGPFVPLGGRLDPHRNELRVRVKRLGTFFLAEQPTVRAR